MTSRKTATLFAVGALALGAFVSQQSIAATPVAGFVGHSASSVAGCPFLEWRLARHTDGKVTGMVWYSDLSGVSQANGTVDAAGKFSIQLTSSMGKGPVGTVTGTRGADGGGVADLKGEGCANMHMVMKAVPDLMTYYPGA